MSHFCRELSLLLLLLAHAQADNCLTAIVGETVQIPCSLKTEESLKTEDISVEWKTSEDLIVHSFVKGQDYWTNQAPQFKGRTQLFRSELSHGNLSLSLSSVSLTDDAGYTCNYHRSGEPTSRQLSQECLQIAGHYSVPVVQGPASPVFNDQEVNFTCKSTGGFPEPKVQWSVNKELLQNSRRVNTTLSRDSRGLYNVTSVLIVNVTGDVSVTCTVENDRLREKTTSAESEYLIKAEKEPNGGTKVIVVLVAVLVVLVIVLIVVIVVLKKRKWKHQRNGEAVTNKDEESEAPLQQTQTRTTLNS
ncbi:CD276 antigen homolog isoform X7 [Erpetoichthys calabaricus]|uniref:CD276 antigen homolog isoform X7 n=1 Tax=Erpetoichthys calabaricus TaxID=27687 RepID=UPI00223492AA|nr:CD276 antigen homolog isoform X7 [Erpetoichthys calabaricus]